MEVTAYNINFAPQELAEWLEKQPPATVVHTFPYSCGCTLTTYLYDVTDGMITSTAGGFAYTESDGREDVREYNLPDFTDELMNLFDWFAASRFGDLLTAGEALEILNNTEIMRGK